VAVQQYSTNCTMQWSSNIDETLPAVLMIVPGGGFSPPRPRRDSSWHRPRAVNAAKDLCERGPVLKRHKSRRPCTIIFGGCLRPADGTTGLIEGRPDLMLQEGNAPQDRLRAAGCLQDVRWAILGYEEKTVAAGYGEGFPVTLLKQWIDKIGF
jgi:hypothetical protein